MKKKPASKSAFFNPRVLIGFSFCLLGLVLALLAFAAYPGGNAFARQDQPAQPEVVAYENLPVFEASASPEVSIDQVAQENVAAPDRGLIQVPDQTSCPRTVLATDGSTSANARAPATRFATSRAVYLITPAELAADGFQNGTAPTTIGWNYQAAPVTGGSAPLIIYMENTADTTNLKSTTWATAISTMTTVHNATTALPGVVGPFDITLSGGSAFTYTGGGLYVAYDWGTYAGTLSTTSVIACNTALAGGLLGANSNAATVAASNFRPETRISSFAANDAAVGLIYSYGELPLGLVPAQAIKGVINNKGTSTLTNLPVTLNVTGANTFTNGQVIASLASCTGQGTATFAGFTPTALGATNVTVTVPADNIAVNNTLTKALSVTALNYSYKIPGSTLGGGVGVTGATAAFVAKFTTLAANAVTDVKLEFSAASTTTYRIAIYGDAAGTPSTTALYTDAADRTVLVAGPVTITLPAPVAVGPGNFYVGIQQTNTINASLSFDTENPIRSGSFFLAIPLPVTAWSDESPGNNFKLNIGIILQTPGPSPTPSPTPTATPTPTPTPTPATPTPTATPSPSASATPCGTTTVFNNAAAITINDASPATPYPSNIAVAGLTGTITKVTVALNGVSHTFPDDIDVLLVGPGGNLIIMSDVGGSTAITGHYPHAGRRSGRWPAGQRSVSDRDVQAD